MALNDVKIVNQSDALSGVFRTYKVEDRTTSGATATIKPGEPVKRGGTGGNYVTLLATGEPVITAPMMGIAVTESTETASADGEVQVFIPTPGVSVMRADATTSGNLANGILNDTVAFDLTGGVFTVDEDEGDDPNVHGLEILGFDADAGTVDFTVRGYAQEYFSST